MAHNNKQMDLNSTEEANIEVRRSFSWDGAFFTSDGFLDAAELTSIIEGSGDEVNHQLQKIEGIESLEAKLFEEIEASTRASNPTCCPCGQWCWVPSSCGNFFNKMRKGKVNTAHCLRFPGDWFHVFGIGHHSVGFNIRINEVVIGPNNRAVTSYDNFLRVNLVGDFVGYDNILSLEDFFFVIPRQVNRKIWEGTFLCGCYLND
ncbi:putative generative cell specific-1/HAP2 domain-containing protein [Helianthus anomalus]